MKEPYNYLIECDDDGKMNLIFRRIMSPGKSHYKMKQVAYTLDTIHVCSNDKETEKTYC